MVGVRASAVLTAAALLALATVATLPTVGSQATASCASGTFWEADELPDVHQLNFVVAQSAFENLVANQMNYDLEITGQLFFNQESYDGVELQVRAHTTAREPTFFPRAGHAQKPNETRNPFPVVKKHTKLPPRIGG